MTESSIGDVKILLFGVFGTIANWRARLQRWLQRFGRANQLKADWAGLVTTGPAGDSALWEIVLNSEQPTVSHSTPDNLVGLPAGENAIPFPVALPAANRIEKKELMTSNRREQKCSADAIRRTALVLCSVFRTKPHLTLKTLDNLATARANSRAKRATLQARVELLPKKASACSQN